MATTEAPPPDSTVGDRPLGAAAGVHRAGAAGERNIGVDGLVEDDAREQATVAQETGEHEPTDQATDRHAQFCNKVGLQPAKGAAASVRGPGVTVPCLAPVENGYYYEINQAYNNHSLQYWFIASIINTLHLSQIIIGATATALGGAGKDTKGKSKHTTAITVLTTIMTVIAALLVYFKSRGQPNRVRQLRNELRKARDEVKFMEIEFRNPPFRMSVDDALNKVKSLYDSARANAEINYPDTWSTPSKSPGK
jgi:hypothetical protein